MSKVTVVGAGNVGATSLKASTFAHVAPTLPAPTTVTFDIISIFCLKLIIKSPS